MITSLSNWRSRRVEDSYLNKLMNTPLGAQNVPTPAAVVAANPLLPLEDPNLAPLTGAPLIKSERDISAVQFNPAMLPVIQEIMLIREKYRDEVKLVANLNQVKGLALLFRNVRLRGKPSTERLDKWSAAKTALNAGIDALFSWAKDMCVEFLTFLPLWLQRNAPSAIKNVAVSAVNRVISALGGVDMTCAKFVDFVRDSVFNEYVFPFINDIIGEKLIDVTKTTQTMYGATSLEEKQIIQGIVADLKKLNASIPAPTGAVGALPPLPPVKTDFGAVNANTETEMSTTTKALIGGAAVIGVVGLVLIASSGNSRDDYDDEEDDEDENEKDSSRRKRSKKKSKKNRKNEHLLD